MTELTLDQILESLENSRQRATYGAVAKLLGKTPRTLMRGRERNTRSSWVVSRTTGKPSGYSPELLHPELESQTHLIDSEHELEQWLAANAAA